MELHCARAVPHEATPVGRRSATGRKDKEQVQMKKLQNVCCCLVGRCSPTCGVQSVNNKVWKMLGSLCSAFDMKTYLRHNMDALYILYTLMTMKPFKQHVQLVLLLCVPLSSRSQKR